MVTSPERCILFGVEHAPEQTALVLMRPLWFSVRGFAFAVSINYSARESTRMLSQELIADALFENIG